MASGSACKCLGQSHVQQHPIYACHDIVLLCGSCHGSAWSWDSVAVMTDIYRCRARCTEQSTIQWQLATHALVLQHQQDRRLYCNVHVLPPEIKGEMQKGQCIVRIDVLALLRQSAADMHGAHACVHESIHKVFQNCHCPAIAAGHAGQARRHCFSAQRAQLPTLHVTHKAFYHTKPTG